MSKSSNNETRNRLFKLREALFYAKKAQDEEKIAKLLNDINEVRDRLKQESLKKR